MGLESGSSGMLNKQPLFSFGVISDVQYADVPNGHSFKGTPRYYRHSMKVLERAITQWNRDGNLDFVINFGDIVDGKCPKAQSLATVKKVISEFNKVHCPVYHLVGNHCLYNLPRTALLALLGIPSPDGHAYYEFSPVPEYRIVALDGYDFSAIGWPQDDPTTARALKFLKRRNPNLDMNSPRGLTGLDRRFLMFNGAVGDGQMRWLDGVLAEASSLAQKVIICCHLPLDPNVACNEALLWNYDDVMRVIHCYDCVRACFSGHDHKGGVSLDSHGIYHRSLEAALECPPGSDAFGYVDVYDDMLLLSGTGRVEDTYMFFKT